MGIFVFISHSSHDFKIARKVRNIIEDHGGKPILFYLKCLDNDNPGKEDSILLYQLISREIQARRRFILIQSEHTLPGHSEYIDWEISEIEKNMQSNPFQFQRLNLNINQDICTIESLTLDFIKKQTEVVIFAQEKNVTLCNETEYRLMQKGFKVSHVMFNHEEINEFNRKMHINTAWWIQHLDNLADHYANMITATGSIIIELTKTEDYTSHTIQENYEGFILWKITNKLKHKCFRINASYDTQSSIESFIEEISARINHIIEL